MSLRSSRLLAIIGTFFAALPAAAQELEFPVSPSPVGSGARAAGMADAFVAIADDATAASWNPAGLVQLERPEISIVGSFNAISEDFMARYNPELFQSHSDENVDLNFLSLVYPLPVSLLGSNATVSLSYQRKYDLSRDFRSDFNQFSVLRTGAVTSVFNEVGFHQDGGLGAITPAFAVELTHRLSVGAALNIWRSSPFGKNTWEQVTEFDATSVLRAAPGVSKRRIEERYEDFHGENVTLGMLWNPTNRLSIGLRYDSAFTGKVDYNKHETRLDFLGSRIPSYMSSRDKEQRKLRLPDSLALGLAYRFNDRFTMSMDVTRTDWHDFYIEDAQGRRFSAIDASSLLERPRTEPDPTYTVRLGGEYVFVPRVPEEELGNLWSLRAGMFYDEEPASGTARRLPFNTKDGDPDKFYGLTAGVGYQMGGRINFDLAYQIRWGNGVNADLFRGIPGFEEDVVQHRVLLSAVVYF